MKQYYIKGPIFQQDSFMVNNKRITVCIKKNLLNVIKYPTSYNVYILYDCVLDVYKYKSKNVVITSLTPLKIIVGIRQF